MKSDNLAVPENPEAFAELAREVDGWHGWATSVCQRCGDGFTVANPTVIKFCPPRYCRLCVKTGR